MSSAKSVEALRRSRAEQAATKQAAVLAAIALLSEEGKDITVSAVARAAQVSREFIHSHPHLHEAVGAAARAARRDGPKVVVATSSHLLRGQRADRSTLLAQVERLRARVAEQDDRLSDLQRQRQRWLGSQLPGAGGALIDPEVHAELRITNERLTAENTNLLRRVEELRRLVSILEADLAASRQAHAEDVAAFAKDANVVSLERPTAPQDR